MYSFLYIQSVLQRLSDQVASYNMHAQERDEENKSIDCRVVGKRD